MYRSLRSRLLRYACATLLALMPCSAVRGQQVTTGAEQAQSSPFTIERVQSGFVIAPDAKITHVNGRTATLAGAYGGWMLEHTIMFGAGGYWLANDSRDLKMMYGGPVVEWLVRGDRRISFGARALAGGGTATLGGTLTELFGVSSDAEAATFGRDRRTIQPRDDRRLTGLSRVIAREEFFVAEPQAVVVVRALDWLHIDAGVGYRIIAGAGRLDDRLGGVSGTVSIVFGGGS